MNLHWLKKSVKRRFPTLTDYCIRVKSVTRRPKPEEIFDEIYHKNLWGNSESVSGGGSSLAATHQLRKELSLVLGELDVVSLLDIPCGDFNWMAGLEYDFELYLGGDIVQELIDKNNLRFGRGNRVFRKLDITADPLPAVDAVLCRDLFVHFPYDLIWKALRNIRKSGSTFLITTSYPQTKCNENISLGGWRPLNLEIKPFLFPAPFRRITDFCNHEVYKQLLVWKIADLPFVTLQF